MKKKEEKLKKFKHKALIVLSALAVAATGLGGAAVAHAHDDAPTSGFRVVSVTVRDAKTVDTRFSKPLSTKVTDPALHVFYADHQDHDTPHNHDGTMVTLIDGGYTARVTLGRALHSENPPCDTDEPRCSDDELPWIINKATDINGNTTSNQDWEVWAESSER